MAAALIIDFRMTTYILIFKNPPNVIDMCYVTQNGYMRLEYSTGCISDNLVYVFQGKSYACTNIHHNIGIQ